MRLRSTLPISRNFLAILIVSSASLVVALAQETPPDHSVPELLQATPLSETDRSELEAAVRDRDYTRAEALLVKLIDQNPKSTPMLKLLGSIFFLDGKFLNCAVAIKKADAIAPIDDNSRFTLAMAYVVLNHGAWAREELDRLVTSDSRDARFPYWLGRLDYDEMQFAAAGAHLQKAIDLNPKFMKAYDNLGLVCDASGRTEEAIQAFKKAVSLNREERIHSPWPAMNLGALLVKLGRYDEAKGYLQESLSEDPRFPKAHFQLGSLLEKLADDAGALKELQQAVDHDPSYPEPYYVMGRIYRRRGDKASAERCYGKFQELHAQESRKTLHGLD